LDVRGVPFCDPFSGLGCEGGVVVAFEYTVGMDKPVLQVFPLFRGGDTFKGGVVDVVLGVFDRFSDPLEVEFVGAGLEDVHESGVAVGCVVGGRGFDNAPVRYALPVARGNFQTWCASAAIVKPC